MTVADTFIPAKRAIDRAVDEICAEGRIDQMIATAYFIQRIAEKSVVAERVLEAIVSQAGYSLAALQPKIRGVLGEYAPGRELEKSSRQTMTTTTLARCSCNGVSQRGKRD